MIENLLNVWNSSDPATKQGLLQAGLSLMQSKGNLGAALGQAGQQGLLGANQFRERLAQQKRQGMLDQLTQGQLEAMQRQQQMARLPMQFAKPMKPASMDDRDVGQPGEAQVPTEFDLPGYTKALMGFDPSAGLDFAARQEKSAPQLKSFDPAHDLYAGGQLVRKGQAKSDDDDFDKALRRAKIDPASPQGVSLARQALMKKITHAPAASQNVTLPKIELKTGESIATQVGPMLKDSREKASSGVALVDSANRILQASKTGNFVAGPLADARVKLLQIGQLVGATGANDTEKLANTRAVVRGMAEQAVAARSQLGGQAQISNAEQALITKATAGEISELSPGEIVQIAQLNKRLGKKMYDLHQKQVKALQGDPNLQGLARFYEAPDMPLDEDDIRAKADAILRGK